MGVAVSKLATSLVATTESTPISRLKPDGIDYFQWVFCTGMFHENLDRQYRGYRSLDYGFENADGEIQSRLNGAYTTLESTEVHPLLTETLLMIESRVEPDADYLDLGREEYTSLIMKLTGFDAAEKDGWRNPLIQETKRYNSFKEYLLDNDKLFQPDEDGATKSFRFSNLQMRDGYAVPGGSYKRLEDDFQFGPEGEPALRCAIAIEVILKRHLVQCHLAITQHVLMAILASKDIARLPATSPLKQYLNLLFSGTNEVNSMVRLMAGGQGSMVQILSGLTAESFEELLIKEITAVRKMTQQTFIQERIKSNDQQWNACVDSVLAASRDIVGHVFSLEPGEISDYRNDANIQSNIVEDLALCHFLATFYHEIVGDKQVLATFDGMLPMRLRVGKDNEYSVSYAYPMAATVMTVSTRSIKIAEVATEEEVTSDIKKLYATYHMKLDSAMLGAGLGTAAKNETSVAF